MWNARRNLRSAVQAIQSGGLVVFPTETVYGVGANATDDQACELVYHIKKRPRRNPLIVHFYSLRQLRETLSLSPVAEILFRNFSPGPLTLILPKRGSISSVATAGSDLVAVRIPRHPRARALLKYSRVPIAAPSANLSGMLSSTISSMLGDLVHRGIRRSVNLVVLDGKAPKHGIESTIVDTRDYPLAILRPGVISAERIRKITGLEVVEVERNVAPESELSTPGTRKYKHYKPKVPLYLFTNAADLESLDLSKTALLCTRATFSAFKHQQEHAPSRKILFRTIKDYERLLYRSLYAVQLCEKIIAELPEACTDALRDRLTRAAEGNIAHSNTQE